MRFSDFLKTSSVIQQKQTQCVQTATFPGVEEVPQHQVVFAADYNILDVVPKWPGFTHDPRILNESGLKHLFERHLVPSGCHLIGDKGYPLHHWPLNPFHMPLTEAQLSYNRAHHIISVVERGISQRKHRHILHSEMWYSPECAVS
ncbi:hypothetical protein H4Q32_030088 [Labeo rohita]|uniref:DDE Tnp4 domain-containing protein n=1 Tax=Labeo rohita TaxID=84645 RepID=A0ABQ8MGS9_LABRO|nr:hypothetical protein H4Q32_030088 [Labeo rohita]